jgi:hypothetical protein
MEVCFELCRSPSTAIADIGRRPFIIALFLCFPIAEELSSIIRVNEVLVLLLNLWSPGECFTVLTKLGREAAVIEFEHALRCVVEDCRFDKAKDHAAGKSCWEVLDDHGLDECSLIGSSQEDFIARGVRTAEMKVSWVSIS